MAEKALAEAYTETRHYALTHTTAACGSQRVGLFVTAREHVTCPQCRLWLDNPAELVRPLREILERPTLGGQALRELPAVVAELAELRENVKLKALKWGVVARHASGEAAEVYRRCAEDLLGLLEPKTEGGE